MQLHAQNSIHSITLRVLDDKQQLLPYTSIKILSDSTTLAVITDEQAQTVINVTVPQQYLFQVASLGYDTVKYPFYITQKDTLIVLRAHQKSSLLKEVEIKAVKKPLMTQEDDKTIINPESLAASSTNGYEILEKTPGLFVDQDGNIYISSTTPAVVYINGREMKMSRSDVASMLKSLPPNSIEKIEILRTPSAKYDASGSGGVVNVVLKKGVKLGLTGGLQAAVQQGRYGNQVGGGNIAYSTGATSMYFNANATAYKNYGIVNTDRWVTADTLLSQEAYTINKGHTLYSGYGINHDVSPKWNIGLDGQWSYTKGSNATDNYNVFQLIPNTTILGTSRALMQNDNKNIYSNNELFAKYKIDTVVSEWNTSVSYAYSNNPVQQQYNTESALPYFGDGSVKGSRHYIAALSDVALKLPYALTLESGLKMTWLQFDNSAQYRISVNGVSYNDNNRSNQYRYTENINAAYLQLSKGWKGFILKAGLRMENTNMDGHQQYPSDTSFIQNRTDFFPYVYFSRALMKIANYELRAYLVYRQSIARPSYEQLNPFPKYVDQFLSEVGNPRLKPQFTNNYEANISIDERPMFAIGYNHTKDMFTNVYYQGSNSAAAQAYKTYDNIGVKKEFYLRGIGAIPPGGIYFFVIGAQYGFSSYTGLYDGVSLTFSGANWLFFTYHQLKIDKRSVLTLNGFMRLKGVLDFYELSSFGALNVNINRKFFNNKLTVTCSLNDIFFTNNNKFELNQPTVRASGYRASDSRRFGINLSYTFGVMKKEGPKDLFPTQD
jgi:iron complex outermembrane receptor protein